MIRYLYGSYIDNNFNLCLCVFNHLIKIIPFNCELLNGRRRSIDPQTGQEINAILSSQLRSSSESTSECLEIFFFFKFRSTQNKRESQGLERENHTTRIASMIHHWQSNVILGLTKGMVMFIVLGRLVQTLKTHQQQLVVLRNQVSCFDMPTVSSTGGYSVMQCFIGGTYSCFT